MMVKKINLVAADMGYGHQRAAYPLMSLSGGEIITINNYESIPDWEKKYWLSSERSYDRISRFKKVPLLGSLVFGIMDSFQKIESYYPWRDLSRPTTQQKFFFKAIKKGLGKHLIDKLNPGGLPFVTTFFVAAYAAEYHNYQGDIYCLVCDSDASRAWAPLEPKKSRIKYLLPTAKLRKRFLMYGVKEKNIFITGFPLPLENIGADQEILKMDLSRRLNALDPAGNYRTRYQGLIEKIFSTALEKKFSPVTITYAVGGAGAQAEIGVSILTCLAPKIKEGKFNLNLVAGNRPEIKKYFEQAILNNQLAETKNIQIIFAPEKIEYFKKFNQCLRETDVLWTKPSELSFYCALGLPIIISAPVGSQEDFNREWLIASGAGLDAWPVEYIAEWLPDLVDSGRLARLAMNGFLNAESMGAYKIEKIINQ